MTIKSLTPEQPQVHAIAAADAALIRTGLPTHAAIMADNAAAIRNILGPQELMGVSTPTRAEKMRATLANNAALALAAQPTLTQLEEAERVTPTAKSETDYLHMQAFNVVIKKPEHASAVVTVLARSKDWALPTARRLIDADPQLAAFRFGSVSVELSPVEAWKVHDWDKMDQRPEVFSSRVQALDCARFHGQGKFQIDELSRAVFYRDPDFKPTPAPAPEAPAVEADPAWEAQKRAAVDYAQAEYCDGSDDNIETDAGNGDTLDEADFSAGEDGVWVRGWLFVPKSALPGYGEE